MGAIDTVKAVLLTCISSYPFYDIVARVSRLDVASMEPCDHGCVFIRWISSPDLPSTKVQHVQVSETAKFKTPTYAKPYFGLLKASDDFELAAGMITNQTHKKINDQIENDIRAGSSWVLPSYAFVRNGHRIALASFDDSLNWKSFPLYLACWNDSLLGLFGVSILGGLVDGKSHSQFLSPVCPGNVTLQCDTHEMRRRIENHLGTSGSLNVYLVSLSGWVSMKILHDVSLLAGRSEYLTLSMGICSVAFQAVACLSGFLWCLGSAEVFVARATSGDCACYYQLPTLPMLFSLATPCLLLYMVFSKISAVALSIQFGDYLYSATYDIPHRYVAASSSPGRLTTTMVVPTVLGDLGGAPARNLSFLAFYRLGVVLFWISLIFSELYRQLLVVLVIAPLFLRVFALSLTSAGSDALSLRICFCLMCVVELGCIARVLVKFHLPSFRHSFLYGYFVRVYCFLKVMQAILCALAPVVILPALVQRWVGNVIPSSDVLGSAWMWSAAGMCVFLVFGEMHYWELYRPAVQSLSIRMFAPFDVGRGKWADFSERHPEYKLSNHIAMIRGSDEMDPKAFREHLKNIRDKMMQQNRQYSDLSDFGAAAGEEEEEEEEQASGRSRLGQSPLLAVEGH